MFHDSGKKRKGVFYPEGHALYDRICLHCGERYGDHAGDYCIPVIKDEE